MQPANQLLILRNERRKWECYKVTNIFIDINNNLSIAPFFLKILIIGSSLVISNRNFATLFNMQRVNIINDSIKEDYLWNA